LLGFVLSFIPIINNLAAILGVIGVILALVGIIGTFRGKKKGKVLSIVAAAFSVLAIVITFSMQAAAGKALDDLSGAGSADAGSASSQQSSSKAAKPSESKQAGTQDLEGDLKSAHVKIVSAVRSDKDYNGMPTVLVTCQWKNNTDKNNSFMIIVNAQAFQQGQALDTAIYTSNPAGYDANSALAEVQPGATGTATIGYVLSDDSAVSVELTDQFSLDDSLKVSHTFKL
jgi:hypothetical protein